MPTKIDWKAPEPRKGLLGEWDTFIEAKFGDTEVSMTVLGSQQTDLKVGC